MDIFSDISWHSRALSGILSAAYSDMYFGILSDFPRLTYLPTSYLTYPDILPDFLSDILSDILHLKDLLTFNLTYLFRLFTFYLTYLFDLFKLIYLAYYLA